MNERINGNTLAIWLCLILTSHLTFAQETPKVILGENVIEDSSFEQKSIKWTLPANVATIVTNEAYEGKQSAHFKNANPKVTPPRIFQRIDVRPGETIYFNVLVKGKNIDASNAQKNTDGARVYIQSSDEAGKFINGMYPKTTGPGTFNWKEIGGIYTVPINATTVTIGMGFMPGVTGEAWFDKVSVNLEGSPLFESFLITPNYRGTVLKNDKSPWKTKLQVTPESPKDNFSKAKAIYLLKDSKNKTIAKQEYHIAAKDTTFLFTPPGLPIGRYSLVMNYFDTKGKIALEQNHLIQVVNEMPKVYIDREGFTIKNGKRIFPFGVYIGHPEPEHLQRIKDAGFNTVLSYGYGFNKKAEAYLDRAQEYNLNVIYSLKDMYEGRANVKIPDPRKTSIEYINLLKNKPALLSWYTVDELLPQWLPKIKVMYQDIIDNDPNHPAFQVHYFEGARMIEKYYYTTDIMATDPYPVGKPNLYLTTIRTDAAIKGMHGSRGVWAVPQSMDWAVYVKDRKPNPPSAEEMRNQAYQALISGAKGMIFYSYYDLFHVKWPRAETFSMDNFNERWKEVIIMSKEISNLEPVILEGKGKKLAVLPSQKNNKVEISALEYNNELFILLANPYYSTNSVSINLPEGWQITAKEQGYIKSTVSGKQIEFSLPSIGSGVFKLTKR